MHGLDRHSSTHVAQVGPENLGLHLQENPLTTSKQTATCWQR